MQITRDDWTPLFKSLKSKVSPQSRRQLLAKMLQDIDILTQSNFGEMANGSMRPWHDELLVSEAYKRIIGRQFATLERTEAERQRAKGTKYEGGKGAHLKDSFVYEVTDDSASMTNTSPYADKHQFGRGVPYRPFYPIVKDGSRLMPFAEERQLEIVDEHFKS